MKLGLYRHFKGNFYRVIGISRHSETLEELVVYQALYSDFGLWVRPVSLFNEKILVDSSFVNRFEYMGDLWSEPPKIR